MAERIDITTINKFDGKNYHQWKFQITCALKAKGAYDVTNGNIVKPIVNETKPESKKELEQWNKLDAVCMFTLTSAMDYSQITLIQNCSTSKEIIEKLDSIYEQKTETNKMLVHERFHRYKMEINDSIAQHIAKVENLAREIRDSGEQISNPAIMTKILSGLPNKFRNFRQAWLSLDEGKQTIVNLTSRLLDEENSLTVNEETEIALSTSSNNSYKNKKQYNYRQQNNYQKANERSKHFSSHKSQVVCYNCRGKGHIASNCRNQKKNSNGNFVQNNQKEGTSNTSAFNVQESIGQNHPMNMPVEQSWIMDSGASAHMTYCKEYFSMMEEVEDEKIVTLGNNINLIVKGKGTVKIQKLIKNKWYDSTINNVLYVPDLRRNLFSEGVITNKGMKIVKENEQADIYENNILTACAIREPNNLYRMLFRTIINEVNVVSNNSLKIWHERLGHVNTKTLREMLSKELVTGVNVNDLNNFFCESCLYGKQHKLPFNKQSKTVTEKAGEFIYSDLCGPMSSPSVQGAKYFVLFKDAYSSYRTVYFLKHKDDVLECFEKFYNLLKNKFGYAIKILRTDGGTDYCNKMFQNYLAKKGIEFEKTAPYTPQQNGRSEREMRTLVESARSMLYCKDVPLYLWAEAVNTAVYVLNRTPNNQILNKTPYEAWTNKKPALNHIKTFGCEAYTLIPKEKRTKLEAKSQKLILVGYDGNSTNYRLFNPANRKITISRNVIFNESGSENVPRQNHVPINIENFEFEDEQSPTNTLSEEQVHDDAEQQNVKKVQLEEKENRNLRPRDKIKIPKRYELNLVELGVPQTYDEAVKGTEATQWKEAIKEELTALNKNDTWDLVVLPPGKKAIGSKWVFKVKRTPEGNISRYKARLCAKGFAQTEGEDFNEIYSPTTRYDSIRVLLAIAAKYQYEIIQFDVKTAFLYGELKEDIYMVPPTGIDVDSNLVCKLKKSLYGLKQAPRCWNIKFDNFLKNFGFIKSNADNCVYRGQFNNAIVLLVLYVDDGLLMSCNKLALQTVISELQKNFEITLSKPSYFVGLEIICNKDDGSIFIHQKNYIKQLIKRFNLEDSKVNNIPADPHACLNQDTDGYLAEKEVPYREAVGSLMFAAIVSRPDIMYAVGVVSRYLINHTAAHWKAVKRIIKYLNSTAEYGIKYSNLSDAPLLTGYSDSDFANDLDTRRSTTGYIFKISNGPVTWNSQRQRTVCLSTTEAEYVAATHATKEAIWLKYLLSDINENSSAPIMINIDNQSAIKLVRNPEFHKRTKHIDICYHFIREKYHSGDIDVTYVSSQNQLADILTKPLPGNNFERLRRAMGMDRK